MATCGARSSWADAARAGRHPVRQPLARCGWRCPGAAACRVRRREGLLELLGDELNVKHGELIGDDSDLVERRVKPLLPRSAPRLGAAIPEVMAAARANEVEYLPDGGVRLAGVDLARGRGRNPGDAARRDRGRAGRRPRGRHRYDHR